MNRELATQPPPPIPDHELLRCIGAGSYGEVWLARNAVGTLRAVKVVHRQSFERAEPFEREFKGLQKFEPISRSHDGLVDILQIGRNDGAGYFYYVMELADDAVAADVRRLTSPTEAGKCESEKAGEGSPAPPGSHFPTFSPAHFQAEKSEPPHVGCYEPSTLRSALQRRGPLPVANCLDIGLALASALQHLHEHGLVHRDIKPSNIIFVNGKPKLADIGLVTAIDDAHSLVGTAGYIPPEGPGTPQADIYSLGKVLYEISLGRDRQDFPQLPPDLQAHPDHAALLELNEVVLKACETDPRKRYLTAAQMHDDLTRLHAGQSVKRRHTRQRRLSLAMRLGLGIAVIMLPITAGLFINRFTASTVQRSTLPVEVNSLAVLPFENENPDAADEFLGTAVADELGTALTRIPGLRVLPRNSAVELKRSPDIRAVARRHQLAAVLTGHVRKSGQRLSISAQLIATADGFLRWSDNYEGEMSNLFGLQTRLAEDVARALKVNLADSVRARLALRSTRNHQSHQLYLEGRYHWHRRDAASLRLAFEKFQNAIALDSNYAQAHAGLADTLSIWEDYGLGCSHEAMPKARAAARKAVALNEELAEAHAALGKVLFLYDWDWAGAEREYRRSIQLDPNYPTARQGYAQCLDAMNRPVEALEQIQKAVELDPLAPIMHVNLVVRLYYQGRYAEAVESFHRARELHPNFANYNYGRLFEQMGRYDQAVEEWVRAGRYCDGIDERIVIELRAAYAASGMRGFWRGRLEYLEKLAVEQPHVTAYGLAETHARLGEHERALDFLEKVVAQRSAPAIFVHRDPAFAPLRSHPRFVALAKKLGLPEVTQGTNTAR